MDFPGSGQSPNAEEPSPQFQNSSDQSEATPLPHPQEHPAYPPQAPYVQPPQPGHSGDLTQPPQPVYPQPGSYAEPYPPQPLPPQQVPQAGYPYPPQQPYPHATEPSQPVYPQLGPYSQPLYAPTYPAPQSGPPAQPGGFGPPAIPPGGLPPFGGAQPIPPPRNGFAAIWRKGPGVQIPLVSAGVLLVLCLSCVMCSAISRFANVNTNGSAYTRSAPTATLTPTGTPIPISTPIPTATATPPLGAGDQMSLGHDYSHDSSGAFAIASPTDHFSSGSMFAYVVHLDSAIGTFQAQLILVKVHSGGSESVVYSVPMNVPDPQDNEFANKLPTSSLMGSQPAGSYKLKLSDGTSIRASAAFKYVG